MAKHQLKNIHAQDGFTIVEIVVVLGITILIMLGLFTLYDNYYKVYNAQEATARVVSAAALTGSELQNSIKQAESVLSSHTISGTTYNSDSDTIVLRLPAVNSSGSLIASQYDYIVFNVDGTRLSKITSAYSSSFRQSGTRQLSDVVGTATFSYNNGDFAQVDRVDVNVNMQVTNRGITTSQNLQQSLYLFNEQ